MSALYDLNQTAEITKTITIVLKDFIPSSAVTLELYFIAKIAVQFWKHSRNKHVRRTHSESFEITVCWLTLLLSCRGLCWFCGSAEGRCWLDSAILLHQHFSEFTGNLSERSDRLSRAANRHLQSFGLCRQVTMIPGQQISAYFAYKFHAAMQFEV